MSHRLIGSGKLVVSPNKTRTACTIQHVRAVYHWYLGRRQWGIYIHNISLVWIRFFLGSKNPFLLLLFFVCLFVCLFVAIVAVFGRGEADPAVNEKGHPHKLKTCLGNSLYPSSALCVDARVFTPRNALRSLHSFVPTPHMAQLGACSHPTVPRHCPEPWRATTQLDSM